jgi:uncharacterized membrane protein (UPF0127 family)
MFRNFLGGLILASLTLAGARSALAEAPAAVAACADPALPHAILDGSFDGAPVSLAMIDVRGAAKPLALAVASDERTRELGLMCVTRLRPQHGMIFVFDDDSVQEFWMKNTLVPLDMVWVASDGTVTHVAANVPASTRDTPDESVARRRGEGRYVIELPGGEAAIDGIRTGVTFSLPTLVTTTGSR